MVSLGLLLIVAISILSLRIISGAFSHTVVGMQRISVEFQRIWDIERKSTTCPIQSTIF